MNANEIKKVDFPGESKTDSPVENKVRFYTLTYTGQGKVTVPGAGLKTPLVTGKPYKVTEAVYNDFKRAKNFLAKIVKHGD